MYTTERTVRVIRAPQEYRSASTTSYLKSQWIPIQPTVQREIREALRLGTYDEDRAALCADLQRDPATLFQFLKALPGFIPDSAPLLDPLAAVRDLPKSELNSLMNTVLNERSVHRVGKGNLTQKEQIIRSILSCTAARALGESEQIEREDLNLGIVAHLRNLGRMLVAWNYPRIFKRAQQNAKHEGISLDSAVEKILGVAPQALGFTIAREWGLHPEILRCIVFDPAKEPEGQAAFQRCGHLCGLSEEYIDSVALAEPGAPKSRDAEEIEARLSSMFGTEALSRLGSSVRSTLESVRQRLIPAKAAQSKLSSESETALKIPRASEMAPEARTRIEEFIKSHAEHSAVKAGLEEMVTKLIPELGFLNGCLYLLDKSQNYLVPVVQVGERNASGYPTVDVRKRGVVAESLFSSHPVVQDSAYLNGDIRPHVTGAATLLGQPIVLSLSWSDRQGLHGDPGALFQGIKACFEALGDIATLEKL